MPVKKTWHYAIRHNEYTALIGPILSVQSYFMSPAIIWIWKEDVRTSGAPCISDISVTYRDTSVTAKVAMIRTLV
jgi:hypothetical protein